MNDEGKKIHCIANPEKVMRATSAANPWPPQKEDEWQPKDRMQEFTSLIQHSTEYPDMNRESFDPSFDAAAVMSSFALTESDLNLMQQQQALQAAQRAIARDSVKEEY